MTWLFFSTFCRAIDEWRSERQKQEIARMEQRCFCPRTSDMETADEK